MSLNISSYFRHVAPPGAMLMQIVAPSCATGLIGFGKGVSSAEIGGNISSYFIISLF